MSKRIGKDRKRLVIDASIARSAGQTDHPVSRSCREFLQRVLEICHRLVVSDAILAEWQRHASRYTRKWRVAMYARKKVDRVDVDPDDATAKRIKALPMSARKRDALLKDRHLIEAALGTDCIVASGDDKTRGILKEFLSDWPAVRRLVWVNPGKPDEKCGEWLAAGAKPDPDRMIGNVARH
ncbi:MAG TPA: hypothetical protein VM031_04950 [Phycisphaerae bacterium]|nr:hypothetical protein [Phycisphaerae bacterium]